MAPSGEYLPRGSVVMHAKKNLVKNNLIQLAVGVDGEGESPPAQKNR